MSSTDGDRCPPPGAVCQALRGAGWPGSAVESRQFLNRLLAVPPTLASKVFGLFSMCVDAERLSARRQGAVDTDTVVDLRDDGGTTLRVLSSFEARHHGGASEVWRLQHDLGIPFDTAAERLRSMGAGGPLPGFYRSVRDRAANGLAGGHFVALAWRSGSGHATLLRPNGRKCQMTLGDFGSKYAPIGPADAERLWDRALAQARRYRPITWR